MNIDREWLRGQVQQYTALRPRYLAYVRVLKAILEYAAAQVCPTAIVQVRAKGISNFAGKCVRRWPAINDPANDFCDLCGGRMITQFQGQVSALAAFLREHVLVDEAQSQDTSVRLGAHEFGYRSLHLIVQLRESALVSELCSADDLRLAQGLNAEIQLRTMAQHAWADVGHDLLYKSAFQVPTSWERASAQIAAQLETVDAAFTQMVSEIEAISRNVTTYKDPASTVEEIGRLQAILEFDPHNADLADQLARRLISISRFDEAIALARSFPDAVELRVALGYALCQRHRSDRRSEGFREGQAVLSEAVQRHPGHLGALTFLAESWTGERDGEAHRLLRRAYEVDPDDPRALAGYLLHEIAATRSSAVVPLLRPSIAQALGKSRLQAAVRINLPSALYHIAAFELLLNRPYEGLCTLARAVTMTADDTSLDIALARFDMLEPVERDVPGLTWFRRMLRLTKRARAAASQARTAAAPPPLATITPPVVIVAGGCDPSLETQLEDYRELIAGAFQDFTGTVISGGTAQGISGIVGDVIIASNGAIDGIGYLPATLPADGSASPDPRYRHRYSDGQAKFSAAEPLLYWTDLLDAGVDPASVKLLGVNGGSVSAFEYHLAHALGAPVGLVMGSGRAADRVINDGHQPGNEGILWLPADKDALNAFVLYGETSPFTNEEIGKLRQLIHEGYQQEVIREQLAAEAKRRTDPALQAAFDRSSREQAHHMAAKLRRIGKQAVPAKQGVPRIVEFTDDEVETLARMEHGRFIVERMSQGWTPGPRNDEQRQRPSLIAWEDLPSEEREKDRQAVRQIPALLAKLGYELVDL
jgi:ppGpp synthetase/RelA/SpoT-type nucleotidyltranferase